MSSLIRFPVALALAAALAGCDSGALADNRAQTGSSTLVSSARHDALYVVNTDQGTLARVTPGTGRTSEVVVGHQPTRVTRVGDRLLVTLKGDRSIAEVQDVDGTLTLIRTVPVGAEPFGIIATEDGKSVYVAVSMQDEVVELDGETLVEVRRFAVSGQPRWLAVHPSGDALYVGSAMGGALHWIDLGKGRVTPMEMPVVQGGVQADGRQEALDIRITGDIAVSPNGGAVAVPSIYLDTTTPVDEPTPDGPVDGGYGSVGVGLSRLNPIVVVSLVDANGRPAIGTAEPVFVATQVSDVRQGVTTARSFPSSVTFAPDSDSMLITMEGSQTVLVAATRPDRFANEPNRGDGRTTESDVAFDTGGNGVFIDSSQVAFTTLGSVGVDGAGPRGVAFLADDEPWVHSAFDREIATFEMVNLNNGVVRGEGGLRSFTNQRTVVADPVLPGEVDYGRRLFSSANLDSMAAPGSGVSCSTCHFDGRNDGLTWTFNDAKGSTFVRNTPSLAGKVSETAPMTWTSEVASVAEEARLTSQGRMGGHGLSKVDLEAIQAFVDYSTPVDVPLRGAADPAIARGKAIFEREDVGCATCHSGSRYTDNLRHDLYDLRGVNTPGLQGVVATAPYLHDGSAKDLAAVLETSRLKMMGDTSMLSAAENADLLTYLKSL